MPGPNEKSDTQGVITAPSSSPGRRIVQGATVAATGGAGAARLINNRHMAIVLINNLQRRLCCKRIGAKLPTIVGRVTAGAANGRSTYTNNTHMLESSLYKVLTIYDPNAFFSFVGDSFMVITVLFPSHYGSPLESYYPDIRSKVIGEYQSLRVSLIIETN